MIGYVTFRFFSGPLLGVAQKGLGVMHVGLLKRCGFRNPRHYLCTYESYGISCSLFDAICWYSNDDYRWQSPYKGYPDLRVCLEDVSKYSSSGRPHARNEKYRWSLDFPFLACVPVLVLILLIFSFLFLAFLAVCFLQRDVSCARVLAFTRPPVYLGSLLWVLAFCWNSCLAFN